MPKNLQFSHFFLFFVIKDLLKLEAKKFYFLIFLGQYCCAHSRQISERSDENWGSLFDLKKKLTDAGRLFIG